MALFGGELQNMCLAERASPWLVGLSVLLGFP